MYKCIYNLSMDEIKSVYEFAWLTTQQIVVTSDKNGSNIKGFGSGFFFQYRDKLFFVTADHVIHPDDFEEGMRLGRDDYVWVLNNRNSSTELATMFTPIGGLFSFDQMNVEDDLSFEIPDMKDITFAMLSNFFKFPFLTHELRVDDSVIVAAGKEKLIISSHSMTELKDTDYCLIEGCVQWDIKDGIKLYRCNEIHQDLTLESIDVDGYYNLKCSSPVKYDEWAGLSGGPVFNDKFNLIGMVISVSEVKDTVRVVPMKKITELMDYAIRFGKDMKESSGFNQ